MIMTVIAGEFNGSPAALKLHRRTGSARPLREIGNELRLLRPGAPASPARAFRGPRQWRPLGATLTDHALGPPGHMLKRVKRA